jgi:phage N-6-adenine-methyltransferase
MKKMGFVHESTKNESKEWYTPKRIFDALKLEFDMDVASPGREKAPDVPAKIYLTEKENGLTTPWIIENKPAMVFLNPPYGSDTPAWVKKFSEHTGEGILLVFSRTDTKWFHDYLWKTDGILFIRGRVQFTRGDGYIGGGCGSGSLLAAKGQACCEALKNSGLGIYVPTK